MALSVDSTKTTGVISPVNEATPLLQAPETGVTSISYSNGKLIPTNANGHPKPQGSEGEANGTPGEEEEEVEKPMPILQMLLLCFASLAEPVAYFAIFPFMPEMAHRTGNIKESDIGFWTGLIESLFSLVQMVLMIFYGRAADKLGRKPVLVFSLVGIAVFTALFGMSQTLWQMILCRCLGGFFAGSAVTIRTMISENTTKNSQARAFSWYMFTRSFGIFLGPLIGGPLANPVEQFPGTFGNSAFFHKYPYALSTYTAGAFCLLTALASLRIKETLVTKVADPDTMAKPPMSTWEVLRSPGVPIVLYIFGHTMLLGLAYTAVSPVALYTDIFKGGFSFSDQKIAVYLAVAGASQALWMLIAFPALQKRLGTGNLLRGCAILWPLLFASYPVSNELLRHEYTGAFWTTFITSNVFGSGVSMAFACVQLCINDISPSSTVLATVNALALTVNSGIRAVTPVAFTSLYALGVRLQWADGHLIWVVLVAIAAALFPVAYFLPERAEGRIKKEARDEE